MLANQMKNIIYSNHELERTLLAEAARKLLERKLIFADSYHKIVQDIIDIP